MSHPWLAERTKYVDSSGIRKVFDLAAQLDDPINLSIGQPDFEVPPAVQQAAIEAIRGGRNGYSVTQGIPELRQALQARVDRQYGHSDRRVLVTSGVSGALVLVMLAAVNPGDEVILFDPYFVMYEALVRMVGGKCVLVDTYPDFRLPLERVAAAITDRTKMIVLGSPANPTGVAASEREVRGLAELARQHGIALLSDEIYHHFCYDAAAVSPASFAPSAIVVDGFSKTYAVTGWRLGFAHGPAALIDAMAMLQQYTFVCAPQPAQWAGLAALEVDMSEQIEVFRRRRDLVVEALGGAFEMVRPDGAFYVFPRVPWGTATEFVTRAIENHVLVIPGSVFSRRDTHFRISYAADERATLRGVEILTQLARSG